MPQTPCPYCGHSADTSPTGRCESCNGLFEPLSRKATQLAMGPWYTRDEARPFMPGFSEAILRQQVASGRIKPNTIVRGPSTNQFWVHASKAPGLSRLLGRCHACSKSVSKDAATCDVCNADLAMPDEIDRLGLAYVQPADRAQAQQEIEAQRTATPTPKPKPKPAADSTIVSPDMLKPVTAAAPATAQTTPAAPEYEDDLYPDIAEDLWHTAPTATVRRRQRRNGPEPLVLAMGVVFLCVVAACLALLIMDKPDSAGDDELAATQREEDRPGSDPIIERDEQDVVQVSEPIIAQVDQLNDADVPAPFAPRLALITGLLSRAQEDEQAQRYTDAYAKYREAQALLGPLTQEITNWQQEQQTLAAAREEVDALTQRVRSLRSEAQSTQAQQWAPVALGEAQLAFDNAQAMIDQDQFDQAVAPLGEAEAMYQMAVGQARAGQAAEESRQALNNAMRQSYPEQVLREQAAEVMTQFTSVRSEGDQLLQQRAYDDAANAYDEASALLRQAVLAVDFNRFRKVYAYEAGFQAAGILLSVASTQGIDQQALAAISEVYDLLRLSENPADALTAGDTADYSDTADALVHSAREAILAQHGEEVRASYQVGFQMQIISQTLTTSSLSRDQQRRISQTLDVIEDQATVALWDVGQIRPVLNEIRRRNRDASLDAVPSQTRQAWSRLLQPLQQRTSASRIMEPVLWPSSPDDPELFQGLGQ